MRQRTKIVIGVAAGVSATAVVIAVTLAIVLLSGGEGSKGEVTATNLRIIRDESALSAGSPRTEEIAVAVVEQACEFGICNADATLGPCWISSVRGAPGIDRSRNYWVQFREAGSTSGPSCGLVRPGIAYGLYDPVSERTSCPQDRAGLACCRAAGACILPAAPRSDIAPAAVSAEPSCLLVGSFNYRSRIAAADTEGKVRQLYSQIFTDFEAQGIRINLAERDHEQYVVSVPRQADEAGYCSCSRFETRDMSGMKVIEAIRNCAVRRESAQVSVVPATAQPSFVPARAQCSLVGSFNYRSRIAASDTGGKVTQLYSQTFTDFSARGITIILDESNHERFDITVSPSAFEAGYCSCARLQAYNMPGGTALDNIRSCNERMG
jgi:hypothetical protein